MQQVQTQTSTDHIFWLTLPTGAGSYGRSAYWWYKLVIACGTLLYWWYNAASTGAYERGALDVFNSRK